MGDRGAVTGCSADAHEEALAGGGLVAGYRGVRVVVIGATGFIGRWVAQRLTRSGAEVHLLARARASAEAIRDAYGIVGEVHELADERPEGVAAVVSALRPSVTFNLAGYGVDRSERDAGTSYRVNAKLVETIAIAVAAIRDADWSGQDLVHVGSALEYGPIGGDLVEDSPPRPTTLYGRSKLAGTLALGARCREYGLRGVTARLFTVYGPGEHAGRLLPSLVDAARTGAPVRLTAGNQRRDFTYVEDVAEALLRLGRAVTGPGEVVNVATGQLLTVRRFAESAARVLGLRDGQLVFGALPTRVEEMEHDPVSVARLTQLLGWIPRTTVEDGIRRTLRSGAAPAPPWARPERT